MQMPYKRDHRHLGADRVVKIGQIASDSMDL